MIVYADNAATTRVSDLAFDKMMPYFKNKYGNASSQYPLGRDSNKAIEFARQQIANCMNCKHSEIFFTSGGSEGNNWIFQRIPYLFNKKKIHIIISTIEHHSIINICKFLGKNGIEISYIPVDSQGNISIGEIKKAIRPETKLVSIMYANNEIGTIQPIKEIGNYLQSKNILFHTDAVQAVGHIPIDLNALNIDFLTASAHKFNGLKGSGFAYIRNGIDLPNFIFGGSQEASKRAGTENVPGIVAMGYALEENIKILSYEKRKQAELVNATINLLKNNIEGISINAEDAIRLPGILNITFPSGTGDAIMNLLSLKNICISTSSACNSGKNNLSHVLRAIGLSERQIKASIRISYGRYNTLNDVDIITNAIINAYKIIRSSL